MTGDSGPACIWKPNPIQTMALCEPKVTKGQVGGGFGKEALVFGQGFHRGSSSSDVWERHDTGVNCREERWGGRGRIICSCYKSVQWETGTWSEIQAEKPLGQAQALPGTRGVIATRSGKQSMAGVFRLFILRS